MKITAVPAEGVHLIWPHVAGHLQKAIDRFPVLSIGDLFYECAMSQSLLWVIYEIEDGAPVYYGAVVTSERTTSTRKTFSIDYGGGVRMKDWLADLFVLFDRYAAENGFTHMHGYGRKGWGRLLAKYNFREAFPVYERKLTGDSHE